MKKNIFVILLFFTSINAFAETEAELRRLKERQDMKLGIGIIALLGGISYGHHIYSQNLKQDYNHKVQYFSLWAMSDSYSVGNFSNIPAGLFVYHDAAKNIKHFNQQIDTDIQQSVLLSVLGAVLVTDYFLRKIGDSNTTLMIKGSLTGTSFMVSRSF
ncbi:hypothetical protein [Leptospira johnsonii]|uniref:Uncharacterized protein n=1 Tax=Leptospira johnsonii TaxID=1917820 RepID=A0A2P2D7W3_9LEPT|nr:hypothetical protein [Leptospira johnsonii]GBF40725.1 hypothetical protein LPTSP1_37430 [Leptospira johnsonii]